MYMMKNQKKFVTCVRIYSTTFIFTHTHIHMYKEIYTSTYTHAHKEIYKLTKENNRSKIHLYKHSQYILSFSLKHSNTQLSIAWGGG